MNVGVITGATDMETSAVEEQLFGPDPTTEYTVEEIGETVIVLSVEPLLQR